MSISTVHAWLTDTTRQLTQAGIDTAQLDAEIILAHTIGKPRTWLHAHGDEEIDLRHQEIADARLDLRLDHVPIAYIIGHKEFYGRRFGVNPHVLIPRPESEQLIELLNDSLRQQSLFSSYTTFSGFQGPALETLETSIRLVDIGTGSGCLGITAKLEHPELDVTLLDISTPALAVAEKNAAALQADVHAMKSDLLTGYPYQPDIILANLPYVDEAWERSEETRHEPKEALFAAKEGLSLIMKCFGQASSRMQPGGLVILEADPRQWKHIALIAKRADFELVRQEQFGASYQKR